MGEGSLYDEQLAALAIKQARGDLIEAAFLIRAYRTTLPRFGYSQPIDTAKMLVERRISATYKDLPGGQLLGPTFDYSHRLLDFALAADAEGEIEAPVRRDPADEAMPRVTDLLDGEGLMEADPVSDEDAPVGDLTREPLSFPADRDLRLQNLARGDEGFLLSLAYSSQRGYGRTHPFTGEIRYGAVEVEFFAEELGFAVSLGTIKVTECQMVNQFQGTAKSSPKFTRGYGLVFGQVERKAMAMSMVDRAPPLGRTRRGTGRARSGHGIRHVPFRQHSGDRFRGAPEASPLCRFPGRTRPRPPHAGRVVRRTRGRRESLPRPEGGRGMTAQPKPLDEGEYNFAYLDEQTKRMIRRAILKGIAVPGYQVPFASREMPMPYGWGTGGVQVTASILGADDCLKVIDQGSDDTTNAVAIRGFFEKTARVETTFETSEASIIQTRHRIPEKDLREDQIIVFQVPIPEPLRYLEPRETETRKMHALEEYGLMHVKLYEDIAKNGHIATTYAYPVLVNNRYVMDPSPTPKFDNPKIDKMAALQLYGAGREKRIYAIPPFTEVKSLDFEDYPFEVQKFDKPCGLCGAENVYLDEVILDDKGGRMFVCSDSDYCEERREAGHLGPMAADPNAMTLAGGTSTEHSEEPAR